MLKLKVRPGEEKERRYQLFSVTRFELASECIISLLCYLSQLRVFEEGVLWEEEGKWFIILFTFVF